MESVLYVGHEPAAVVGNPSLLLVKPQIGPVEPRKDGRRVSNEKRIEAVLKAAQTQQNAVHPGFRKASHLRSRVQHPEDGSHELRVIIRHDQRPALRKPRRWLNTRTGTRTPEGEGCVLPTATRNRTA